MTSLEWAGRLGHWCCKITVWIGITMLTFVINDAMWTKGYFRGVQDLVSAMRGGIQLPVPNEKRSI